MFQLGGTSSSHHSVLRGNFPILATAWTDEGSFDETSQACLIDWLIESGVHGLVLLANASEAHAMSESEQARILKYNLGQIANRVPAIVTVSHFSAEVAVEKAQHAEDLGAACVMSLPPFFGRWHADRNGVLAYFETLSSAVNIPVMVQDHEVSGVVMPPEFLSSLAQEFENVRYFKVEYTQSPWKIENIRGSAGNKVIGVFGGTSGVYFVDEYERGACGTMPACYLPSVFTKLFELLDSGEMDHAYDLFMRYLPLLHFELRMADRCLWKTILKQLGVIRSDRIRGPLPGYWDDGARRQLFHHVTKCRPETFGASLAALRAQTH